MLAMHLERMRPTAVEGCAAQVQVQGCTNTEMNAWCSALQSEFLPHYILDSPEILSPAFHH